MVGVVVELLSPLSPQECEVRLQEVTDCGYLGSWFGSRPMIGRVYRRKVELQKRVPTPRYQRVRRIQPILVGSLEEYPEGTLFRGQVGVQRYVVALMAIFLCVITFIGLAFLFAVVGGQMHPAYLVIPLLLMLVWVWNVWDAWLMAQDEGQFLVNLVSQVINGSEPEPTLRPASVVGSDSAVEAFRETRKDIDQAKREA